MNISINSNISVSWCLGEVLFKAKKDPAEQSHAHCADENPVECNVFHTQFLLY